jgi:hypothetical protein
MLALFVAIGAAGFWLRGAAVFQRWTGRGATTARLLAWALPMGALSAVHTDWYNAAAIAVGLYLGTLLGWWRSLDLGRVEGEWLRDFVLHTARGLLWTLPAALVCAAASFDIANAVPLIVAGLLCGVLYEVGWRAYPPRATEIGEATFGGAIGAALYLSL